MGLRVVTVDVVVVATAVEESPFQVLVRFTSSRRSRGELRGGCLY